MDLHLFCDHDYVKLFQYACTQSNDASEQNKNTHTHTHNHTNLTAQQVFIFLLSSFLDEFCVLCLVVVVCEILVFNSFNRKTIKNFANFNANKV